MLSSKFCSLHMSPSSFFQLFHFIAFHHFIALLRRAASFYSKRVVIIPSTLFYSSLDVNSKLGYKETKRTISLATTRATSSGGCDFINFQFFHPRATSTRFNFLRSFIQLISSLFNFSNSHNSGWKVNFHPHPLLATRFHHTPPFPAHRPIHSVTTLPSHLQLVDSRGFSSINYAVGRRRRNIHYGSRAVFRNARVARFMDRPRASRLSAGQDYRRQPSLPSSSKRRMTRIRGFYWYELHARNDMCIRVSRRVPSDHFHEDRVNNNCRAREEGDGFLTLFQYSKS